MRDWPALVGRGFFGLISGLHASSLQGDDVSPPIELADVRKALSKKEKAPEKPQERLRNEAKLVPAPAPPPESTRLDVKVHSAEPLPADEKVDVTVIVNDTKVAETTAPPKPAVSIDINTKERDLEWICRLESRPDLDVSLKVWSISPVSNGFSVVLT